MKLPSYLTALALTRNVIATPLKRAAAARPMENLNRGIVAVHSSETDVFVSWRLLGLDDSNIGFNLYRSTDDAEGTLLNSEILLEGTNYVNSDVDLSKSNTYWVHSVIDGEEQSTASSNFTLAANNAQEPVVRIPIEPGDPIRYVWVGDLDNDGEFDFVIDRHGTQQGHRSLPKEWRPPLDREPGPQQRESR